jgi:Kef-type K+ transport system membrane component KefB
VAALAGALLLGKFLAAWGSGWAFKYTPSERLNVWSLSLPQVAATLAAAMVAYACKDAAGRRLIDEPVLNAILALVLLTATLAPILTEQMSLRVQRERGKVVPPGNPSSIPVAPAT